MFVAVQFAISIFISIVYFSTRISITLCSTLVVVFLARDRKMRGGQKFLMARDSLRLLKLDFTYFNRHSWLQNAHLSQSARSKQAIGRFLPLSETWRPQIRQLISIGEIIVVVGYYHALLLHLQLVLTLFLIAIHEIFAKNAEAFPDKECVVETKSSQKNERSFTYRQIHEASNLLAHHFLSHGCKVGDVVMIYAYRGLVLSDILDLILGY